MPFGNTEVIFINYSVEIDSLELEKLIKKHKLKKGKLAEMLGISRVALRSKILPDEKTTFTIKEAFILEQIFDIPISQIFLPKIVPNGNEFGNMETNGGN